MKRIFVLPGTLDCGNWGDVAMLQVALRRLRAHWPAAEFHVLTSAPDKLRRHCPEVLPVIWRGGKRWLEVDVLPHLFTPGIPKETRRRFPLTGGKILPLTRLLYPPDGAAVRQFARAFFNSDLVVMSGCGLVNDEFQLNARRMLELLAAADRCDILTAMLGQGLGPIRDERLLPVAARVLPRLGAIFVRERGPSCDLLRQFSVAEGKIFVTGDDAVELAFDERRPVLGGQLGINLRLASYAALNESVLPALRRLLAAKAQQFHAGLAGIPILQMAANSDVQTLEHLVEQKNAGSELGSPLAVIRRISGCRVVVAGSYHAGVFALAQGIPVIGIIHSDYYRDKFQGLAAEFGDGCVVLGADDPEFSKKLGAAIDEMWARAGDLKPKLLAAAERQIHAGRAAYTRLPELVGSRPAPGESPFLNQFPLHKT
jgi:colanic acid/amylovoran biosynthesis protein